MPYLSACFEIAEDETLALDHVPDMACKRL